MAGLRKTAALMVLLPAALAMLLPAFLSVASLQSSRSGVNLSQAWLKGAESMGLLSWLLFMALVVMAFALYRGGLAPGAWSRTLEASLSLYCLGGLYHRFTLRGLLGSLLSFSDYPFLAGPLVISLWAAASYVTWGRLTWPQGRKEWRALGGAFALALLSWLLTNPGMSIYLPYGGVPGLPAGTSASHVNLPRLLFLGTGAGWLLLTLLLHFIFGPLLKGGGDSRPLGPKWLRTLAVITMVLVAAAYIRPLPGHLAAAWELLPTRLEGEEREIIIPPGGQIILPSWAGPRKIELAGPWRHPGIVVAGYPWSWSNQNNIYTLPVPLLIELPSGQGEEQRLRIVSASPHWPANTTEPAWRYLEMKYPTWQGAGKRILEQPLEFAGPSYTLATEIYLNRPAPVYVSARNQSFQLQGQVEFPGLLSIIGGNRFKVVSRVGVLEVTLVNQAGDSRSQRMFSRPGEEVTLAFGKLPPGNWQIIFHSPLPSREAGYIQVWDRFQIASKGME